MQAQAEDAAARRKAPDLQEKHELDRPFEQVLQAESHAEQ
jgi:hypothetical protein